MNILKPLMKDPKKSLHHQQASIPSEQPLPLNQNNPYSGWCNFIIKKKKKKKQPKIIRKSFHRKVASSTPTTSRWSESFSKKWFRWFFFLLIHVDPLVKSLSTKYFPATRLVGTFSFQHQIMRFYLVWRHTKSLLFQ